MALSVALPLQTTAPTSRGLQAQLVRKGESPLRFDLQPRSAVDVFCGCAAGVLGVVRRHRGCRRPALREGDVGESAAEEYFPKSEFQESATSTKIPCEPAMRIGHGYDIHKMLPKDEPEAWGKISPQSAVIGGVTFEEFPLGVVAHSDGDVVYHSTTDAILGALGLPDIGQLFPDNDPRWRGANSEQFFDEAVRLMGLRGYRIGNVDVTIIAEKPRLAGRKADMKDNIVRICDTIPARVNLKAFLSAERPLSARFVHCARPLVRMAKCRHGPCMIVAAWLLFRYAGCFAVGCAETFTRRPRAAVPSRGILGWVPTQRKATADFSAHAAKLFDNMRGPAALLAGAVVPIGFAASPKITSEDPPWLKRVKRLHYVIASVAICCHLTTVVWSTITVNKLNETTPPQVGSLMQLLKQYYELQWIGCNVNFIMGLLAFACLLVTFSLASVSPASHGLVCKPVACTVAAAICFMVSIVNDGVSQGDGGGVRFGSNMFFLFARYVTLLATHALKGPRPLLLLGFIFSGAAGYFVMKIQTAKETRSDAAAK
ncbi:ISPF [Symbiodinium natans]|uniref:2-C-methyl-D-erythritol 2,4-cyclodiphosphate synthase n=1 Tax=Symbiodinium natans TaxID=878477 RepID=A0A812PE17_9DINO|nr:ISPF [Symbiodinium natans]